MPIESINSTIVKHFQLNSYGTIKYLPTTSETIIFRGINCLSVSESTSSNVALIKNSGGNAIRLLVYQGQIIDLTLLQNWKNVVEWARANNLAVIFTFQGTYGCAEYENWQYKADTVYNVEGLADQWIEIYSNAIRELQPDWVDCMNEPPNLKYTDYYSSVSYTQFSNDYKSFILDCIDAFIAVKPDLKFIVESSPFWDLSYALTSPRIDESRPNLEIMYDVHNYYCYSNKNPNDLPDSYADKAHSAAYWNGDLTTARNLLFEYLLNSYPHIQTALDLGLEIYIGEAGVNMYNPNWDVFMDDMFDFCDIYNIGINWHSWFYSGLGGSEGMLNSDWETLNAVGEHWVDLI